MFLLKIPNSTHAQPIVILIVVVLIPIIEVLVPRVVVVARVLGRAPLPTNVKECSCVQGTLQHARALEPNYKHSPTLLY